MRNMPLRDITGKCEGECRNIIREADERRQREISSVETSFPGNTLSWAKHRSEQPGVFGGRV